MDFLRFFHLARARDASFARVAADISRRPTLCFFAVNWSSPNNAARRFSSRSISRRVAKAFCSVSMPTPFIGSTLTLSRCTLRVFSQFDAKAGESYKNDGNLGASLSYALRKRDGL